MANAIWPHITVHDGKAAIEFYQKGLGAVADRVMPAGNKIMHASLKVGDAVFMLNDDFPEHCGGISLKTTGAVNPVYLHLNVPDCDAAFAKMVGAGAIPTMPPWDAFWGDRYAQVTDPFGHQWSFSNPLPADRARKAAGELQGNVRHSVSLKFHWGRGLCRFRPLGFLRRESLRFLLTFEGIRGWENAMNEMNLELTGDERDCLVKLLEHVLDEVKIEEHRTRAPTYRKAILEREHHLESVLGKLKQWSAVTH